MKRDQHNFLIDIERIVQKNLSDIEFNVSSLADEMQMSRVHLHRRLVKLLGEVPSEYIRKVRLEFAANRLKRSGFSIKEISLQAGFKHFSYFTKCFKEKYGMTPSVYREIKN